MALVVADRVLESSTTTGTGAFTLTAAYTGYRRFSAVCSVADTLPYCIEAIDGNGNPSGDWETGLGTYSSANTLTRTTPAASSNAGAAVNFAAGSKRVSLDVTSSYLANQIASLQPLDTDLTSLSGLTLAQGDILYRDGTQLQKLAAGTAGRSLITGGSGANPAWGAPQLIQQYVGDGTQTSYTFSSIPAIYTDLILTVSARSTSTSAVCTVIVNGLTTSIYDRQRVFAQNTTVTADEVLAGANWGACFGLTRSGDTAGFTAGGEMIIYGYAQTSLHKAMTCVARHINSATTGNGYIITSSGVVRTTAAISSITVAANAANNFATGSLLTLFGRG